MWLKKKKNHLFFLGSSLFIYEMKRLYKISVLAWTAKTNYHSLGGLGDKHGFLSVLGKPKIKALVDSVSGGHSSWLLEMHLLVSSQVERWDPFP